VTLIASPSLEPKDTGQHIVSNADSPIGQVYYKNTLSKCDSEQTPRD